MSTKSQTVFAICFGLFLAVVVTVSLLFADKLPHATQPEGITGGYLFSFNVECVDESGKILKTQKFTGNGTLWSFEPPEVDGYTSLSLCSRSVSRRLQVLDRSRNRSSTDALPMSLTTICSEDLPGKHLLSRISTLCSSHSPNRKLRISHFPLNSLQAVHLIPLRVKRMWTPRTVLSVMIFTTSASSSCLSVCL